MKVAVVLGNRLQDDGTASEVMRKRLDMALKKDKELGFDLIVLTGGAPNDKTEKTEAEVMRDYLLSAGIAESKLVLETKSKTTVENAKYTAPILKELGISKFYLISSAYHIERSYFNPVALFKKKTALEVVAIKAD